MDNESNSHTQELIQEGKKDKREDKHHHARMCETNDVDVHSYLGVAIIVVSEEQQRQSRKVQHKHGIIARMQMWEYIQQVKQQTDSSVVCVNERQLCMARTLRPVTPYGAHTTSPVNC